MNIEEIETRIGELKNLKQEAINAKWFERAAAIRDEEKRLVDLLKKASGLEMESTNTKNIT